MRGLYDAIKLRGKDIKPERPITDQKKKTNQCGVRAVEQLDRVL